MDQRRIILCCAALLTALGEQGVAADSTRLLEADLHTGTVRRIDGSGPKTTADRDLDAMLDKATGGTSFSTDDLERIEKALRRFLQSARLRAMPRLLLFLYPGRISRSSLRELRQINVDVELVVDPCTRTVCTDSVARSIELLGRSMKQTVLRTSRYTITFTNVTIRTVTEMQGAAYDVYRFAAEQVVQAGDRAGGGASLMGRLSQAKESYGRQMVKDIAAAVKIRRVRLSKPPRVEHDARSVSVELDLDSDRVRYRSDVLAALAGTAQALRRNPLTPASGAIGVVARVPLRAVEVHRFSCTVQPLTLFLDGRLSQGDLWATYIVEKKKGGTALTFDDAEAAGHGAVEEDGSGEDRTGEIVGAHFGELSPCLSAEAARNPRFRGATLAFSVSSAGRVVEFGLKEGGASASLRSCLQTALFRIRFPKHGGAPRQVEYPMVIKR